LSCGCILENKTLFSKIFLLPGGSTWTFQNGNLVKRHQYFKPETWENRPVLDKEIYYDRLRGTFNRILPRYFNSKNLIGFSLTGGLDTRMILAFMDVPPGTMPCYTFGGMYRDSLDVIISRRIAQICKQTHQTLRLDTRFLSDFSKLAEKTIYITDGNRDVTGAANLYVNKLAREIAPIRMTGNGGQEVLRRYVAFKPNSLCETFCNPDFVKHLKAGQESYNEMIAVHRLSFTLFRQAPWSQYGTLALEQSQLTQRSPYMDNDLVEIVYQAPEEATVSEGITARLIRDGNPQLAGIMTDRGNLGKLFLFSWLTRAYYEFLFKMEYYYNHGMPQRLVTINHTLRALALERLFIGHYKYYFFRKWFQNELSEYMKNILLDGRTMGRPYLKKEAVSRVVKRHVEGKENHTYEIDMILTTELIQRLLIEQR
jgi:asparagine synthase (glutamine-hydrolysing)